MVKLSLAIHTQVIPDSQWLEQCSVEVDSGLVLAEWAGNLGRYRLDSCQGRCKAQGTKLSWIQTGVALEYDKPGYFRF